MADQSIKNKVVFCSACGAKNTPNDKFCSSCGAKMAAGTPVKSTRNKNSNTNLSADPKNKKRAFIAVGILVILLLVGLASRFDGFPAFGNKNKINAKSINSTYWMCNGGKENFQECSLPANYTADTGLTKVSSATCDGGVWTDLSYRSSDKTKIVFGICKSGKCVEKYGSEGIFRLTGVNNSCPVGAWNY